LSAESTPSSIGPITFDVKSAGKPSAGKRHAGFDAAGTGNVTRGAGLGSTVKMGELPPDPTVGAPVLDPTERHYRFLKSLKSLSAPSNISSVTIISQERQHYLFSSTRCCAVASSGADLSRLGAECSAVITFYLAEFLENRAFDVAVRRVVVSVHRLKECITFVFTPIVVSLRLSVIWGIESVSMRLRLAFYELIRE
jgi:hypothetical protein